MYSREWHGDRCLTPFPPRKIYSCPRPQPVPAPFAALCPHPHPVTAHVIPTPLPYFLSPSQPCYRRVVQTKTPHSQSWRRWWIILTLCPYVLRFYVNSFYFLHFVRNVIILLIFNLLHNTKYTSEYYIHLATAQCSLITKVQRTDAHIQIPSTAGDVDVEGAWLGCFPHSRWRWQHHYTRAILY